MDPSTLLLDQTDGVLTLTLNRPAVLNALDLPQWEELARAFELARDDSTVRALVITGAGRAFSAGADIRRMRERRGAAEQIERLALIDRAIQLLAALPRPTIAAVNGIAVGVSTSLVLACDLAVAAQGASLSFSWIKLGLVADGGGSWLLTRLLGPRRARELLLTARPLPASEALAWGLFNEVTPEGQALERAQTLARELAAHSPHAIHRIKELVDRAVTGSFAEQLAAESLAQAECIETEEHRAAVAAFLNRRSP